MHLPTASVGVVRPANVMRRNVAQMKQALHVLGLQCTCHRVFRRDRFGFGSLGRQRHPLNQLFRFFALLIDRIRIGSQKLEAQRALFEFDDGLDDVHGTVLIVG